MTNKAIILMASYNGQEFIGKQIDSFIKQTFTEWDLYIRDDGSKDNTLNIIKKYEIEDQRIHLLKKENDKSGACLNFYELFKFAKSKLSKYEYFFLADQDDLWDKEKMSIQIKLLQNKKGTPLLTYSDLYLMSHDGTLTNQKMSDIHNIELTNKMDIFYNQIFVWGNTIALNRELMKRIVIPDNISNKLSHDHYLSFYGAAFGQVIYIDQPLTLYRRHEKNVSDLPSNYKTIDSVVKKLRKGLMPLIDRHAQSFCNVLFFIDYVPEITKELGDVRTSYEKNWLDAIRILRKYNVVPGSNKYNILVNWFLLVTGLYKLSNNYKIYRQEKLSK